MSTWGVPQPQPTVGRTTGSFLVDLRVEDLLHEERARFIESQAQLTAVSVGLRSLIEDRHEAQAAALLRLETILDMHDLALHTRIDTLQRVLETSIIHHAAAAAASRSLDRDRLWPDLWRSLGLWLQGLWRKGVARCKTPGS